MVGFIFITNLNYTIGAAVGGALGISGVASHFV
jgi:hypothetical protein